MNKVLFSSVVVFGMLSRPAPSCSIMPTVKAVTGILTSISATAVSAAYIKADTSSPAYVPSKTTLLSAGTACVLASGAAFSRYAFPEMSKSLDTMLILASAILLKDPFFLDLYTFFRPMHGCDFKEYSKNKAELATAISKIPLQHRMRLIKAVNALSKGMNGEGKGGILYAVAHMKPEWWISFSTYAMETNFFQGAGRQKSSFLIELGQSANSTEDFETFINKYKPKEDQSFQIQLTT